MANAKYVYFNGKIVPWDEARVHVYAPVVKYGAGVFEGIRGYWNEQKQDMFIFKMKEHMDRLRYSQTVMRFANVMDPDEITEKTIELIRANEFRETVHIRPAVFIEGDGTFGAQKPVGIAITAVPRPMPERVKTGCTAQVSSWMRIPDRVMPARVKAHANYNNSRLAQIQAKEDGYETCILLNSRGHVSEGPGMCFFMIRNGKPVTPDKTSDILESITRETMLQLFPEYLKLDVEERAVDRSELYGAEEAFFCGTGWEITPVTAIDGIPVGTGKPGPITKKLQDVYFGIAEGRVPDHAEWRMPVYKRAGAKAAE